VDDFLLIAKVKSIHGNDGFLSIESFSDFQDRFLKLEKVFADFFGVRKEFIVEAVDYFSKKIVIKIEGFNNSDDASIFIGKNLFVCQSEAIPASGDVFFIHDLIGSEVFQKERLIGVIVDVLKLPANDVYLVKNRVKKEILIPAVKDFIQKFDAKKKRVDITPEFDLTYYDED
jgi:16S rRNA processing protein RimM